MDDEDRSEFGIAPRQLQTKTDFSGQKRPHQKSFHDGPIPGMRLLFNAYFFFTRLCDVIS